MTQVKRRRTVVDDSPLALRIGDRIRLARHNAGLTQEQLARGRYTKAYISALEKGHAKPSMAALNFIAERLNLPPETLLAEGVQRWSRLQADILLASGQWQEAADAYDSLLEEVTDRPGRAELLRGSAEALCRLGRGVEAIKPAAEALELFDRSGRLRDAILAGYWLANAQYLADNAAEARSILRMLLDRVRAGVEIELDIYMRLLTAAAYVETWDGKHQRAVTYLEEARALTRDLDDRRRAGFLSALASAYLDSGDIEGAVRAGSQSIALYRAFEAEHEVALVANNLANAYLAVGNLSRATDLAAEAHREHEGERQSRELATVLDTQARIKLASGDVDGAIALAERATSAAEAADNQKALADSKVTRARASTAAGRPEDAIAFYESAAEQLREGGSGLRLATVLAEWAELLAVRGEHEKAYALTREALTRR